MKKVLFAAVLAVASLSASGQTRIEGILRDSLTHEVEPYATVRVFREGQTDRPVGMSLTDERGEIRQAVSGAGRYLLVISSVGKKDVVRKLTVCGETVMRLGEVYTVEAGQEIGAVEVIAQRPIVKMETDRMTYNVQDDADAQALTVLEMLRKVPMVTVDAQDNIAVNGSSSFRILVDGKPNIQLQGNAKQILKSIPASMVEKIEVLTHPGAKYDAEGVGGVLNLILHHEGSRGQSVAADGLNGELSTKLSNRGEMGALYLAGQHKRWTYHLNSYVGYGRIGRLDIENERRLSEDGRESVGTHQYAVFSNLYTGTTLDIGYEIDSMNVLNASLGVNYYDSKRTGLTSTLLAGERYGGAWAYSYDATDRESSLGVTAGADWQHFINRERTHSFTLSYMFGNAPRRQENTRRYQDTSGAAPFALADSYSDNRTSAAEHTLQADYTVPLGRGQGLSVGAKYVSRNNHADASYDVQGNSGAASNIRYDSRQQILAGYMEHTGSYGRWSTREGLRYEHTWESIGERQMGERDFRKRYGHLVPSFTASYRLASTANLGLTYMVRIMRPGISYMNPYRDLSDATAVRYGNPDLDVERAHYVNLVFNYYGTRWMMNATLSQSFCNNQIASYSFVDEVGKLHTTYGNNVSNRWTNLNMWMRYTPGSTTALMLNAYLGYGDIRSDQLEAHNDGWQASAVLAIDQQLPWQLKWNVGLQTSTRKYELQGYQGGMSVAYTMLTRSFCKDRLHVSLYAMSPISGKLKVRNSMRNHQFEDVTTMSASLHTVQLTIGWKLGSIRRQFAKHQSKIENNFGENQSQGQQISNMGSGTK